MQKFNDRPDKSLKLGQRKINLSSHRVSLRKKALCLGISRLDALRRKKWAHQKKIETMASDSASASMSGNVDQLRKRTLIAKNDVVRLTERIVICDQARGNELLMFPVGTICLVQKALPASCKALCLYDRPGDCRLVSGIVRKNQCKLYSSQPRHPFSILKKNKPSHINPILINALDIVDNNGDYIHIPAGASGWIKGTCGKNGYDIWLRWRGLDGKMHIHNCVVAKDAFVEYNAQCVIPFEMIKKWEEQYDALWGRKIEEFDAVRTTVPLKGSNVFDDRDIYQLPVGSEGTVVDICGGGRGFTIEFLLFTDPGDPDYFVSVELTLERWQFEPVCV